MALAAGATTVGVPAPAAPDSQDPDPGRAPRKVCMVYDGGTKEGFNFSRARAASLRHLLASVGIEASVWPSEETAAALSSPCSVAHFVALKDGVLGAAEFVAIDGFLSRGGKIVAWGCTEPELASRLSVRPAGGTVAPPPPAKGWREIRPDGTALPGAPDAVESPVPHVAAWEPAGEGATTAAAWSAGPGGAAGAGAPAAAIRSENGFWLGRVLYDDGSARDRARFVAAVCCALDDSLWSDAAAGIGATIAPEAARAAWLAALAGEKERELEWARAHPISADRAGKPLGVWEKTGFGPFGGDWEAAAEVLDGCGATDVFLFAGSLASATADLPGIPPTAERARRGGKSPFPDALKACRARGIKVHAWFQVLFFDGADEGRRAEFSEAGRLLRKAGPDGGDIDWLDPENPQNAEELEAAVSALAASGIDGICLDYVRYPDFDTAGPHPQAAVDALVERLAAAARAAGPEEFAVMASVFGSAANGHERIGQNWGSWLSRGVIDTALPMNYVATEEELRKLLDFQKEFLPRTWCGVGVTSHAALLSGRDLFGQLRTAWRSGCAGCALYPFDARFAADLAPLLGAGQ